MEKDDRSSVIIKQLIAGGVAGAVSRTVVSPFERMKILFQVQSIHQSSNVPQYRGLMGTLTQIYKNDGIIGYFKGNGTNCIRIIPYSAVQFATYEQMKRFLTQDGKLEFSNSFKMISGAIAGITSVSVTYPLDVARTRLCVIEKEHRLKNDGKNFNIMGVWRYMIKNEGGFRALYSGLSPTLFGIAPYVALNFTFYETIKELFVEPTVANRLVSGGTAGIIAQTITYPFDIIRRRFQVMKMGNIYGYQ
jgi:solute carrier family 25 phosphate transporter 23/24/25/41